MKKTLATMILAIVAALAVSSAQQSFSVSTTNTQSQAIITQVVSVSMPLTVYTGADCLCIGQQIGAMTNSSGQKLFAAGTYTNVNSLIQFAIADTNSMVPWSIGVSGQITH